MEQKLSKNAQLKLINAAFDRLDILNNLSMTGYRNRLFKMEEKEEREHRAGAFDEARHGITSTAAAKLFTVHHILEPIHTGKYPSIESVLHVRPSLIYGASISANYADLIKPLFTEEERTALLAIDYAELING